MKKITVCLLMTLLFLLSACGNGDTEPDERPVSVTEYENKNGKPQSGGTLRLALTGGENLNPITSRNRNNGYVFKLIYDGLFEVAPDQRVLPVLCESYTVSEDGLSYSFQLKKGVSFHNGAACSAADADATLSLIMKTEGVYRERFSCLDSHHSQGQTLYIQLNRPIVNFPALLDFPILSAADIASVSEVHSYVPNGTGRYKVQSYKKSKELYLSVNRNYHRGFAPYIENVLVYQLADNETAISMLENLQLDLLPSCVASPESYTPKRSLSQTRFCDGNMTFVGINNQQAALLTPLTRMALSKVLDKQALLDEAGIKFAGKTDFPMPDNSYWSMRKAESEEEKGIDAAKRCLEEDGWFDSDSDGILDKVVYQEKTDLVLEILVNEENQSRQKLAESIKSAFGKIGVVSQVKSLPFSEYKARIDDRSYDLFIGGTWISANYDLSFLLKTDENPCGISNERIDRTLQALAPLSEEGQKHALFYDLCETLEREMPLIPLYFKEELLMFDNRLKGSITPSASDIFYGIENWYLETE